MGCEKLDLSCRKALVYPCSAWPLPCPGAVRCRRVWYPPMGFFRPFSKEEWWLHCPSDYASLLPWGCRGTCELTHRNSVRRCWELQKHAYFRGRYSSAGNEFVLSQHPDKKSYFLTMISAFFLFKFSRSIFFNVSLRCLKASCLQNKHPKGAVSWSEHWHFILKCPPATKKNTECFWREISFLGFCIPERISDAGR